MSNDQRLSNSSGDLSDMIRVYLAAPLKTDAQRKANLMISSIIKMNYLGGLGVADVYLPQDYIVLPPNATREQRRAVYDENIRRIIEADLLVAILDEKDTGVIYEMGYRRNMRMVAVYMIEVPQINVMLTEGCYAVCNGADEFRGWLQNPRPRTFGGQTE